MTDDQSEKHPPAASAGPDGRADVASDMGDAVGPLVPNWLVNVAALGWRVFVVAALLIVLWYAATLLWVVTASVAVAAVIAAVMAPFVLRLRGNGRSPNVAAGIVWALAVLVGVAVVVVLGLVLLQEAIPLAARVQAGVSQLQLALDAIGAPAWVSAMAADLHAIASDALAEITSTIVGSAAEAVTILILVTFLLFFFMRDGDRAWLWTFQTLGEYKRDRITRAGDNALERVGGYLRGMTAVSFVVAATNLLFLLLLGVPHALALTLLTFLAGFIPYFGGIVASVIILLVSYGALGAGPTILLLVLMGIRGVVVGSFLRPTLFGRTVNVHPALVLVALPAGYQLAGVVGLFAAVPVTAACLAVASATVAILEPFPKPSLPGLVPAWLDRAAQASWRLLVVIGLVGLAVLVIVTVPLVVIPVALALILAASLEPLVARLTARGRSRGQAAAIAVGGGFVAIVSILWLTFSSLVGHAISVGAGVTDGAATINDASGGMLGLPAAAVTGGARAGVQAVISMADGLAVVATALLLGTLLTFYFLRDGGRLWARVVTRARSGVRDEIDNAGRRAFDVLGGYMIGTAAISFVGAASQFVIMVLLGLPLALPVFVLSLILGFIPYIGSFLSTGIAFLIAVAAGTTADVVFMGIWTVIFNIVQGNVVSPLVYGRTVHLHPAIVLLAIPAGSAVAGIVGMFIVVPAVGIVAATWRSTLGVLGAGGGSAPAAPAEAADRPTLETGDESALEIGRTGDDDHAPSPATA